MSHRLVLPFLHSFMMAPSSPSITGVDIVANQRLLPSISTSTRSSIRSFIDKLTRLAANFPLDVADSEDGSSLVDHEVEPSPV